MEIPVKKAEQIYKNLASEKKICIISHRNPDCDTIGCNLALSMLLQKTGHETVSACADELPPELLCYSEKFPFVKDFNPDGFDLFVSLDSGSEEQAVFPLKYKKIEKTGLINIDHHPSNTNYGAVNLVVENAASTTMILYHLFKIWKQTVSRDMATALLCGLYSDTGSFMHSNTNEEVFDTASELLSLGAKREMIVNKLFRNRSVERLQVLGKILSEAQLTGKNVVVSAIRDTDFETLNAKPEDMTGAIDYLNMTKGNRLAALLSEDGNGNVRGSLRTKSDDLNVSDIAMNLGGGGHKKASGFTIKGKLEKVVRWSIK
jgi:bifunctional oligoribonuclease and PAP phosphatase NrnA